MTSSPTIPSGSDTLVARLRAHLAARGDVVFTRHLMPDGVRELTFTAFVARAERFAHACRAAGVGAGDVALIFLPTSPDALPAFVGAMMIGAIPSFMPCPSAKQHPDTYWESHRALLARIGARLIVTDAAHASAMRVNGLAAPERAILCVEAVAESSGPLPAIALDPDAIAFLQHSSGTTALKKGVALTHRAVLAQIDAYAARLGATAEDSIVSWLPLYHDMGLVACSILPLVLGQTVTILDPFQWAARPAGLFEALDRYDGRLCWLPNFAFEHLTRAVPKAFSADLSRVRAFINCSEPCKAETFDRFRLRFNALGVRSDQLQTCYAMAETVFAVSQTRLGVPATVLEVDRRLLRGNRIAPPGEGAPAQRLLSAGRLLPGLALEIRDGARRLRKNRVGEIVITGPFLFDGYFQDPLTTAEHLSGHEYRTRDRGFVRAGELYVIGRIDDLVIVNGRNLQAHEVEALAGRVPGLKPGRAAAFGQFSARTASEELIVLAERDPAIDADEAAMTRALRDLVLDETGIDVGQIGIVEPGWLVKTSSGKISRDQNQRKWTQRARDPAAPTSAAPARSSDDALDLVRGIVSRLFEVPDQRIGATTRAADVQGWDSLAHAAVVLEVETAFGIRFSEDEMFGFANVGALAARAAELRAESDGQAESRVVHDSEAFSIVALGEPGDAPDLVIFAGARQKFGGELMDFASTLSQTRARACRKLFVTDKARSFYFGIDEVVTALARLSPGPKIVIGNSMGGFGALRAAPLLEQVIAVLSFVPVNATSVGYIRRERSDPVVPWEVTPRTDTPYCIVYGEIQDHENKAWAEALFADPALHRRLIVPNVGHRVVGYLDGKGLLVPILESALDPATMGERAAAIVAQVEPSLVELREAVGYLSEPRLAPELAYLERREREEAAKEAGTA